MDIEGTYTLQAASEDVRNRLADAQTLLRTLPGAEQLESLDGKKYSLVLNIGHGPLAGYYSGHATVLEQENPHHFHFTFEGEGPQSKIRSDWILVLDGYGEHTVVAYKASVSLGKSGRGMSASIVKGAIKLLIQEFFASLSQQIAPMLTEIVVTEEGEFLEVDSPHPSTSIASSDAQPTLTHTIVRRLHLGSGDERAEEQWVRRMRRFGITSILLLLVWIGTRLPRKQQRF